MAKKIINSFVWHFLVVFWAHSTYLLYSNEERESQTYYDVPKVIKTKCGCSSLHCFNVSWDMGSQIGDALANHNVKTIIFHSTGTVEVYPNRIACYIFKSSLPYSLISNWNSYHCG